MTQLRSCRYFPTSLLCLVAGLQAWAGSADWQPLIERLVSDGYSNGIVHELFSHPQVEFDPEPMSRKMKTLFEFKFRTQRIKKIQKGLNELGFDSGPVDGIRGWRTQRAIGRFEARHGLPVTGRATWTLLQQIQEQLLPADARQAGKRDAGPPVYESILVPERLQEAREFLSQNASLLREVRQKYGPPEEIVVAILTVESRVGKYLGSKKALVTLASMALCRDFSLVRTFFQEERLTRRRLSWLKSRSRRTADWAYRELKALLDYTNSNDLRAVDLVGSVYGAIGVSQLMPTNAIRFGIDGDGDGTVDLFNLDDAVHSLGNYLHQHGWKSRLSRSRQARVLYRYNPSRTYVNTVLAVADRLRQTS